MASKNHPGISSGRTVKARDLQYIQRPADAELLDHCRNGRPAYILHSPQMGKSSLIAHTAEQLNATSHHAVLIDLSQFSLPPREEEWFHNIVRILDDSLDLSTDAMSWWANPSVFALPPYIRLTKLITEVILPEITKPLVLFIDEIERTMTLPFRDHFFEWLATLYESRATNSILYRLSFVVCGVATPSQLIPEGRPLLFQWSHRVVLSDFTLQEALPLAEGLSLPTDAANETVTWVYGWTEGHPYLTQLLCQLLEEQHHIAWLETEVDECIRHFIVSPQGLREPNFQFVRRALTEPDANGISLLEPYLDLLEGKTEKLKTNPAALEQLRLVGVLRDDDEEIAIRNTLYQEAFPIAWVKRHLRPPTPAPESILSPLPATQHSYVMAACLFLLGVGLLVLFFRAPVPMPLSVTSPQAPSVSIGPPPTASPLTEITKTPQQPKALAQAQEKIQELEVTIAEYKRLSNEELLSVQKQRAQLEAQRHSQETTISDLRAEVATMEAAFLDQQNASQQALLNFESERAKLTNTLASATNERDASQLEAKTLGTALLKQSSLSPSEIKQLITDRNQLEGQLTVVNKELAGVQQEARELTASLAQQELNSKSEVTRLDRDRAQLQTQLNTVRAELQQRKDILTRTEQHSQEQRTLAQQELTQLGQVRADVQQQLVASQDALKIYHDRISALEIQNTTYSQDLKKTLEANLTLSAQLQDSQQTEAQILNRVGQLESDLIQQQNTADSKRQILQQERDQLSHALANAIADLETTNNRMTTLTAQLTSSKQELANRQVALRDIHAASTEKNRHAGAQVAAPIQTRTDLEARLHKNEATLSQAQQRIPELKEHSEKITGLTKNFEIIAQEREKLSAKLTSSQHQLAKAQQQILGLEAALEKKSQTLGFSTSPQASVSSKNATIRKGDSSKREKELLASHILKILSQSSNSSIPHHTQLLLARQAFLYVLQSEGRNWSTTNQVLQENFPDSAINLKNIDDTLGVLTFDPNRSRLVGSTQTGTIWIWSLKNPANSPEKFQSVPTNILSLAFSPNGKWLASGGEDNLIRVWDTFSPNTQPKILRGHKKAVTALTFNANNDRLVSGSKDRHIRFWNFSKTTPESFIVGKHSDWVNSLFFSADKQRVISMGEDRNIHEWDPSNMGSPIRIFRFQKHGLSPLAVHPSGGIIAKELQNNQIGIWNLEYSSLSPNNLLGNIGNISSLRFSPKGNISSLRFSPKGNYLVSISSGNSVRLWNWESFDEPSILLSEGKRTVSAIAVSSDNHKIAIARERHSVIIWPSPDNLAESICQKAQRNLSLNEWKNFIGDTLTYERTCWNFPLHTSYLEEGRNLAKKGFRKEALAIFTRAKELDPYLDFDPKREVEKLSAKPS